MDRGASREQSALFQNYALLFGDGILRIRSILYSFQFLQLFTDNPLLKKKGVPECILFVTTRITKYPLLIESLIKAAQKDRPSELEVLKQANNFVKVN